MFSHLYFHLIYKLNIINEIRDCPVRYLDVPCYQRKPQKNGFWFLDLQGKPGKLLYLPCSLEEAYKRLIAFYELASKKEPAYRVMLDGIRQEFTGPDLYKLLLT